MTGLPDGAVSVQAIVAVLRQHPEKCGPVTPHPGAAALSLPDGCAAPGGICEWAAFDNHLPLYLAAAPSELRIADDNGVVLAEPMGAVLREVCLDSIPDELDGDEETIAYLEELIEEYTTGYPGFGIVLEPPDHPERILWLDPAGTATALTYRHDRLTGTPWGRWSAGMIRYRAGRSSCVPSLACSIR
jgi:hypothetical protein